VTAAQCLLMKQNNIEYDVLCFCSAIPNASLLITEYRHPDYTNLIFTEDLDDSVQFRIHDKLKNRIQI
jgi:hypothetical protein